MLPLNVACCGLVKSGATSAPWGGRGAGVWDTTGQTMPASDSIKFIYIIICVHLVLIYDLCSPMVVGRFPAVGTSVGLLHLLRTVPPLIIIATARDGEIYWEN